jgi:O-antigen ligase
LRSELWTPFHLLGLVLLGAVISWSYVVPTWPGFSAGPFTALLLATSAAFVVGRLAAAIRRSLVPAAVVAGSVLLAGTTPDVLSGASLGGPLGYANANGAFFVQASVAGLMLTAASRTTLVKAVGLVTAIALGVVPFAAKSLTSAILLILLPVFALTIRALAGARVAIAACAAIFIGVFAASIILGSTYASGVRASRLDRLVDATLDERRVALWHEAIVMMRDRPVVGVGLGGFQALSPTARSDRDARWAHNSFIQHGAETGLIGLVLLTLLVLWGFSSLSAFTRPDILSVLGAVGLSALAIHACVDYVLHFPLVPVTAAALVGAASLGLRTA